jgi:metal-responsive CopG/Arc/MetJ family transcriptional regulator
MAKPLYDRAMGVVSVRIPAHLRVWLDQRAGTSRERAQLIRDALERMARDDCRKAS